LIDEALTALLIRCTDASAKRAPTRYGWRRIGLGGLGLLATCEHLLSLRDEIAVNVGECIVGMTIDVAALEQRNPAIIGVAGRVLFD